MPIVESCIGIAALELLRFRWVMDTTDPALLFHSERTYKKLDVMM